MKYFSIIPRIVKILEIWETPFGYRKNKKRVTGKKLHIGTYHVAEHPKTAGLEAGDAYIVKMHYSNQRRNDDECV